MEAILKRRSIRKYKDLSVEKEKIKRLLQAGMQAPSAGNQQPWEFIVIQDPKRLEKLSFMSPYSRFIKDAPLALILLANEERMKYPENWQQDMGAAAQNILLEAVELNLGGVWLGVAPLKDRMNYIKEMFHLKENLNPYCALSLGYPEGKNENKFIDRYNELRVHYETY